MVKIALIITGFLRSFNYENLRTHILDRYRPDIYIHLSSEEHKEDKYLNKTIPISEVAKLLQPRVLLHEPEISGMNNVTKMWYKIYRMSNLITEKEKLHGIKYDVIIRYRPDMYFLDGFELLSDNLDSIIIPQNSLIDKHKLQREEDPYICDIFAYGPAHLMKEYCKTYLYLVDPKNERAICGGIIKQSVNGVYGTVTGKVCQTIVKPREMISETALFHFLHKNRIPYRLVDIKYRMILSQCNIIGICGDSGSGKTTLTELLQPLFGGKENVLKFECDRYHKWERGNENWQKITHLNPEANYLCKMRDDCFDLKIGQDIYQVDYDHKTGKFTNKEMISSKDTVILCGLHTFLCEKTKSVLDIKIFVDTDRHLQNLWKCRRDVIERGHPLEIVIEQIMKRENDVKMYIEPQRDAADIIIKYYTLEDITVLTNESIQVEPKIQLQVSLSKEFDIRSLIEIFEIAKVEFYCSNYDPKRNIIEILKEGFDPEIIFKRIMRRFGKDGVPNFRVEDGFSGLIQCIVLYVVLN